MTSPSYNIDDLLHAAGGLDARSTNQTPSTQAAAGDDAFDGAEPTDEQWQLLETHLQAHAEARVAGREAPGWPAPLAAAMIDSPELRRAWRTLVPDVTAAVAEARPASQTVRSAAASVAAAAAASLEEATDRAGETVRAVLRCVKDQWAAVSTIGLNVMDPTLTLARGAAATPVALQGVVGDAYLVSMSLTGDPTDGCALDLQCQEVRPGQAEPKSVPSFCLRGEDGKRYHSRDRIAHVEPLFAGRHVLQLEVTGRRRGAIVLQLEDEDAEPKN